MSSQTSRLAELAATIAQNTAKVDDYLIANKLSTLSFELDAPVDLDLPRDIRAAREYVLGATTELKELMLGPRQIVVDYQVCQDQNTEIN